MRTLFHSRWLLALLLLAGGLPARATHLMGGDITYTALPATAGVPRYHITVRLFNSDPQTALSFDQTSVELVASTGICGVGNASNFSLIIPRSQVSTSQTLSCATATLPYSYRVNLFEADVNLAPGPWTLSVVAGNRAADIQNITNAQLRSCYISTTLNSALAPTNSSPAFLSSLLPYVCGNTIQRYNFSAFDADGDSLAYVMTPSQETPGGGSLLQCGSPVSGSLSPHFTINGQTGELTRTASNTQQGRFAMAARVYEYRRLGGGQWQLLGFVTRDIIYLAYFGTNQPPTFTNLTVNSAAQALDQPITAQAGQTLQLVLTATDPDAGQLLRFASGAPGVVPGLSVTALNGTQVSMVWQVPATLPPGRYSIPVAVLDNGCPYNASEDRTLVIAVGSRALATQPASPERSTAYPVPFREQVQFTAAPGQVVIVVDALGREVTRLQAASDGRVQWQPAAGLPAGFYLARSLDGRALAHLLRAE